LKKTSVVREAVFDTAHAAKRIRDEKMENAAAIASKEAAEHFGLKILDEDIHDKERGENIQRYLLLARSAIPLRSDQIRDVPNSRLTDT